MPKMPASQSPAKKTRQARGRRAAEARRVGSTAMEDYLEQIFQLIQGKGYARVVDIAERLGISQASVTNMIKRMDTEGLVIHEKYRGLTLSERGEEVARYIVRRHEILKRLLDMFGIDGETVHRDVEGMEHHISSPTLKALDGLVRLLESEPELVERARRLSEG